MSTSTSATTSLQNFSSLLCQISNPVSKTFFDDTMTDEVETADGRHSHSGSILEYQQLYNRYTFCLANLQESIKEVDTLSQENEFLRLANADLADRLSLLSQATIQNCLLSDFNRLNISRVAPSSSRDSRVIAPAPALPNISTSPPNVIQHNRFERPHFAQGVPLPKSISIRSSGYLKVKPQFGVKNRAPTSQVSSPNRVNSPPFSESEKGSQRVYVAGGEREEKALELDVYNQGMSKTELCNKWQETGACPYGENCQFAHGITELRPVIRHPRYKTEVCRMVLAGYICPYGHRCHFRHSLGINWWMQQTTAKPWPAAKKYLEGNQNGVDSQQSVVISTN